MESKLPTIEEVLAEIDELLIEPVWNRNVAKKRRNTKDHALLIEPVWNRNPDAPDNGSRCRSSFNRTSMESKHAPEVEGRTFILLLIEPVWNRNKNTGYLAGRGSRTFNRTSMESKL